MPDRQDYKEKPMIDGVRLIDLTLRYDDSGDFCEIARMRELSMELGFNIEQINFSRILPNTIKAFHLHENQEDIWFVHGRLIVGLYEPKTGKWMKLILGPSPQLLYIPRGIAHGFANPFNETSILVYLVNQRFNPDDEFRLPYDTIGADFWNKSND